MEQVMGLLIFLLLGLTTPALAALKGFHLVDQVKTWTEAQSYCRDKFTDLATIENQDDWTTVKKMLVNSGHSVAWMGLYDDVKSWRWSLDNTSLYSRDLGGWFTFTADNDDGAEHCAGLHQGKVFDSGCEAPRPSVCFHEPSNSYTIVRNSWSWHAARTRCRQNHTELASVRDPKELDAIINVTDRTVAYWIGLSREGWKWSDQSDSSFRRWRSDRPSGRSNDCGLALENSWFDSSCGESHPFICSDPLVQHSLVLRVAVESHGSVNMNDPALQEAILKQMKQRLRAQGVTQPLGLSWRKQPNGQVWFNNTEL